MYLAVDIGGTKTLTAVFNHDGKLINQVKFRTPAKYPDFFKQLLSLVKDEKTSAICCALPATIDRSRGVALSFGNLAWKNVPMKEDLSRQFPGVPVFIENDAKLAGLSEAQLVLDKFKKVLYLTVSTGIGGALVIDGVLDKEFLDMEVGSMLLEHNGNLEKWERLASGKALKQKYGLLASQITDPKIWDDYARNLAIGIYELMATLTPEVIILGGGVGAHLEKFQVFLEKHLKSYQDPMVKIPPIIKAQRPEEAVIYGCYDYIKQSI